MMGATFTVVSAVLGLVQGEPALHLQYGWRADYGRLAVAPYPADHPWSAQKPQPGATPFFDAGLLGSQAMSCASVHSPRTAWADNLRRLVEDHHPGMDVRSPTLLTVAWPPLLHQDGKFASLEAVSCAATSGASNAGRAPLDAVPGLYDQRVIASPGRSHQVRPPSRTPDERSGLISSQKTLTSALQPDASVLPPC